MYILAAGRSGHSFFFFRRRRQLVARKARVFATLRDSLRIREEQLAADSDDVLPRPRLSLGG